MHDPTDEATGESSTRSAPGVDRRSILQSAAALGLGGIFGTATANSGETSVDLSATSEPVDYVDPFIGTTRASLAEGGGAMPYANMYPGPTRPHGMVQLSPDTGTGNIAGYHYEDDEILGFSHTHVSGTGCFGLGNILLTGATGADVRETFDEEPVAGPDEPFQTVLKHDFHFNPLQINLNGAGVGNLAYFPEGSGGYSMVNFDLYPYLDGAWHNYVVTYEAGSGLHVYVDGEEIAVRTGDLPRLAQTDVDWGIGGAPERDEDYFGAIDEFRLYDRALDPAEVQALADGSVPSDGQIVTYLFDDADVSQIEDQAGGDQPGTVSGDLEWVDGVDGQAVRFDGDSDIVTIADGDAVTPQDALTVSAWFKADWDGSVALSPPASTFSHDAEAAQAGYYSVDLLEQDLQAELSATDRVGVHRYTMPDTEQAHFFLDSWYNLADSPTVEASIEFRDDRTVVGSQTVDDPFCGGDEPYDVYYAARFSEPFDEHGVYRPSGVQAGGDSASGTMADGDAHVGGYVTYTDVDDGDQVEVHVGISYVSTDNALDNVMQETADSSFDAVRTAAREAWNDRLSRVRVEGMDENKVTFYTALYNAMKGPTVFEDANGEYVGMDDEVYTAEDYHHYQMFSLWDTFRSEHPLLNIVEPEVQTEAIRSLLDMYDHGGWLPKWQFVNRYTNTMIAEHATSAIAESYVKGLRDYDVQKAYEAMKKGATEVPGTPSERQAYYTVLASEDERIRDGSNRAVREFDLTPFLGDGTVYLRFDDAFEDGGWGARVHHVTVETGSGETVADFTPSTDAEDPSLYDADGSQTGGSFRYADGSAYFVYAFDVPDGTGSLTASVDLDNQFEVAATATQPPTSENDTHYQGRLGLEQYLEYGYIPADDTGGAWGSVSTTLEDAYCDYALAQVAKGEGKTDDYELFRERAGYGKNLFNPETKWMQPRLSNGEFVEDFDPRQWGGYTEGNSWIYSWFVPQDVGWLVEAMGEQTFVDRLDHLFDTFVFPDWGEQFSHYWHGNEPGHHIPYLYNYVGQPWKTQEVVQDVMTDLYTTGPDGYPGNEDVGQMSAWFALSAMGFHPVAPASGAYLIGSPLFERVEIDLPEYHYGGETFTIQTRGMDYDPEEYRYIDTAHLNGEPHRESWFTHADLEDGGTLTLAMDDEPNDAWGVEPHNKVDMPPSMSDDD